MVEDYSVPGMVGGLWAPERVGSYAEDCATGRGIATALLALIKEQDNPALFGTVVRAITAGGTFEGVEIGFCSTIGIRLIVA